MFILIDLTEIFWKNLQPMKNFPHSSVAKESTCNAGDPSLIPGSGRSTGEGIGYPLQYSRASLVAQLVKNLPSMQETWVQSLGWEDPLEKGKPTHSSILAWRIPWTIQCMGSQRVGHNWATFTFHFHNLWEYLIWYGWISCWEDSKFDNPRNQRVQNWHNLC